VNNHEQQDILLRELDFVRLSIMIKPDQENYLRTIDSDNMSKAIRIVIDSHMKEERKNKLERHLLLLLVMLILGLGVFQILWL
jgi:hypothetical protein